MTDINRRAAGAASPHATFPSLERRTVLAWSAASVPAIIAGAAMIGSSDLLAAGEGKPAGAPAGFAALSRMLVGHRTIDESLIHVAWSALSQREADFPARFEALRKAVEAAGLQDMEQWKTSSVAADPALKATAVAIVGAWYLGLVGEVKDRLEDGPAFITYSGALMWAPTIDVTVIPTYARGHPGYWAAKPDASTRA